MINKYNGVKVFSATMAKNRDLLGDDVTTWLQLPEQRGIEIVDTVVSQSSDNEFHCISITMFYNSAARVAELAANANKRPERPLPTSIPGPGKLRGAT